MQHWIDIDINALDDGGNSAAARLSTQNGKDLLLALEPMLDIFGQFGMWLLNDGAMCGHDLREIQLLQATKRGEIVEKIALWWRNDDRTGPGQEIAREQNTLAFEQEAEMVKAVSRCVQSAQRFIAQCPCSLIGNLLVGNGGATA